MNRERIVALRQDGWKIVDIAEDQGVSRQTVSRVLDDAGLTRKRVEEPKYVDVPVLPEHKRQPAYRMFLAMAAEDQNLEVGRSTQIKLKSFRAKLKDRVWTYDKLRGFHYLPRDVKRHGDKPFIAIEHY